MRRKNEGRWKTIRRVNVRWSVRVGIIWPPANIQGGAIATATITTKVTIMMAMTAVTTSQMTSVSWPKPRFDAEERPDQLERKDEEKDGEKDSFKVRAQRRKSNSPGGDDDGNDDESDDDDNRNLIARGSKGCRHAIDKG